MVRLDTGSHLLENVQRVTDERELRKKAAEFEGMLIAQILQKLNECYKLGNSDDDDSTSESFQSLATSAVGGGLARSGGLGVGEMIVKSLQQGSADGLQASGSKVLK